MSAAVEIRARLSSAFSLDASFTAPPGFTILFGASGSGKTTVLRAIAGLTRPQSGRIVVGARTLFDSTAGVDLPINQRRVGYVFQQLALFPHLTVQANIAYGLHTLPAAEQRHRVASIAASFHIGGLLQRRPGEISGGERQRVALARALVTEPAILLLDEPLSALDHAIQSRIMADLRQWHQEHRIPVVYVTHSHREAYGLGERVVVMSHGRVLATGSPHDVLDHPTERVLASLAGFENVFDAIVAERDPAAGVMRCRVDDTTHLEVPLAQHQPGDRVRLAIRAGDILLASGEPRGLSARNVMAGRVVDLTREGPTVIVRVDAGCPFIVHVTPGGAERMHLAQGATIWVVIKTYSCRVLA
jgi:molybdate transport system ATP-binding protein